MQILQKIIVVIPYGLFLKNDGRSVAVLKGSLKKIRIVVVIVLRYRR
jgi:hypothetical protein